MLESKTIIKGALRSRGVQEVQNTDIKRDKKSLNRLKIQDEVFDINDSVADNSKLLSLLMTTLSRMYMVLDDNQKDLIDPIDRGLIEYTFNKFSNTNTLADVKFAEEGIALVDRLLERQAQIGTIVGVR